MLFQTFTFTILPTDVNKEVSRIQIPNVFIPVLIIVAIIPFIFIVYSIYTSSQLQEAKLEQIDLNNELSMELAEQREKALNLEGQVAVLEGKNSEVKDKLSELNVLETELREHMKEFPIEISGSGGIEVPLTEEERVQFEVADSDISDQSTNLIKRYEDALEDIVATNKEMQYVPTIWPADSEYITSKYGSRSDPFNSHSALHTGIDIRGTWGDPVYASASGTVTLSKYNGGYGNSIKIKHNNKYETLYGHLMKVLVNKNEVVEKGDLIGRIGSTGRSTGPHLHFEILESGEYIDPKEFLQTYKE